MNMKLQQGSAEFEAKFAAARQRASVVLDRLAANQGLDRSKARAVEAQQDKARAIQPGGQR